MQELNPRPALSTLARIPLVLALTTVCAMTGMWTTPARASVDPAPPVAPTGGCWTYRPGVETELGDLTGATSVSDAAVPWGENLTFVLSTTGSTVIGGTRRWRLVASGGLASSVVSGSDLGETVTLSAQLGLQATGDGADASAVAPVPAATVAVPLDAEGLADFEIAGDVELADPGAVLRLEAVHLDLPARGLRIVCNGQALVDQAGDNPISAPLPTQVQAVLVAHAATSVGIGAIDDQAVSDTARVGDVVTLDVAGFDSDQPVDLTLCQPEAEGESAPTCTDPVRVQVGAAGGSPAQVSIEADDLTLLAGGDATGRAVGVELVARQVLPEGEPGGADGTPVGAPVSTDADADTDTTDTEAPALPVATTPLWLIGDPVLGAQSAGEATISVAGTGWDPSREVVLTAVDADGADSGTRAVAAGEDASLVADLGFAAEQGVARVTARQQHGDGVLETTVALVIAPAPAPTPGTDDPDDGDSGDTGGPDGDTDAAPADPVPVQAVAAHPPAVAAAPTAPVALDIPAPEFLDVLTVAAGDDAPIALVDGVAVMNAELVGESNLAELFGAGPVRTMRLELQNFTDETITLPGLDISVSKGGDVEPVKATGSLGRIEAKEVRTVEVPIQLPLGAFGAYQIVGQIGDGPYSTFALRWETQPWGLFGLNAVAAFALAWAIRRRFQVRKRSQDSLAGTAGPGVVDDGAAVIDLAALSRWWGEPVAGEGAEFSAGPLPSAAGVAEPGADAVVDVAAVDHWLHRVSERSLSGQ